MSRIPNEIERSIKERMKIEFQTNLVKRINYYMSKLKPGWFPNADKCSGLEYYLNILKNEDKILDSNEFGTGFVDIFKLALIDTIADIVYDSSLSVYRYDDPITIYNQVDHVKRNLSSLLHQGYDNNGRCMFYINCATETFCTVTDMRFSSPDKITLEELSNVDSLMIYTEQLCIMIAGFNIKVRDAMCGRYQNMDSTSTLLLDFSYAYQEVGVYSSEQVFVNPNVLENILVRFSNNVQKFMRDGDIPAFEPEFNISVVKDLPPSDKITYVVQFGEIQATITSRMIKSVIDNPLFDPKNTSIMSCDRNLARELRPIEAETIRILYAKLTE